MPHINVKMFPGRSEELKAEFAAKVRSAASEALGIGEEAFSVQVEEVAKEDWNAKVAATVPEEEILAGKMFHVED